MKTFSIFFSALFFAAISTMSQTPRVPASYSNIKYDSQNQLYYLKDGERYYAYKKKDEYTIQQLLGNPTGTKRGIYFDFKGFKGTIIYGLIPYGKSAHPLPVYRFTKPLYDGKVAVNISTRFKYPFDFVDWQNKKMLTLGYRLINEKGEIIFDGEVSVTGSGPFKVVPTIYEGPFVSMVTDTTAVIWFNTSGSVKASVEVDGKTVTDIRKRRRHELHITGLKPGTKYDYTVKYGELSQSYHFITAPEKGSRKPFIFAYTSDSREGKGGGERNIYGTNAYISKKMAAVAYSQHAAFVQFTGDMVNGYVTNAEELKLQLTNWKKAVEPFWHYMPFYVAQGNHEALGPHFYDKNGQYATAIDGFPFNSNSSEAIMKVSFVNPENGPISEDNSKYDPHSKKTDFPSYSENVFYYTYDNVAMIVLNSNYWYAPGMRKDTGTSGGLHGYIMDNQLEWLKKTIKKLEKDDGIDHIFVTQHTPTFPNGGHSRDDMWYNGDNSKRPYIAGKPVDKGIIERRDEYLDILINKSTKVVAILTGDEHNYNRLKITKEVPIYPENYDKPKIDVSRPIFQINNGACGAPYYSQEILPWSDYTEAFSVENAICLFHVDGKKIKMEVINPDTLNKIDEIELR
jgi:hypothetical protein